MKKKRTYYSLCHVPKEQVEKSMNCILPVLFSQSLNTPWLDALPNSWLVIRRTFQVDYHTLHQTTRLLPHWNYCHFLLCLAYRCMTVFVSNWHLSLPPVCHVIKLVVHTVGWLYVHRWNIGLALVHCWKRGWFHSSAFLDISWAVLLLAASAANDETTMQGSIL